jgi:hypothetical protein
MTNDPNDQTPDIKMMDALKIFIQKNRNAFDAATPGAHGWKGLERMLQRLPEADALERQILCDRVLLDTAAPSATVWAAIENHLNDVGQNLDLEGFIQKNRDALDVATPDLRVWGEIAEALPAPSPKAIVVRVHWQHYLLRAAASVALLVAGIGVGMWYARSSEPPAMAMSEVSGEYKELEQFYQRDITVKRDRLATFTGSQPAEIVEDLEKLDQIMEELRHELANVPPGNREQVVRAMIENYKAKTAILQRVLERLEDSKTETDNSEQKHGIKNI